MLLGRKEEEAPESGDGMRAELILQLCAFLGRGDVFAQCPGQQAGCSVSVAWAGHGMGHAAQAAFLGEAKTKAKGWQSAVTMCVT